MRVHFSGFCMISNIHSRFINVHASHLLTGSLNLFTRLDCVVKQFVLQSIVFCVRSNARWLGQTYSHITSDHTKDFEETEKTAIRKWNFLGWHTQFIDLNCLPGFWKSLAASTLMQVFEVCLHSEGNLYVAPFQLPVLNDLQNANKCCHFHSS